MSENSESQKFCHLFIGGLSLNVTNTSLKSYFERWGEMTACYVVCDPHTKKSRGFGFITYKNAHMVDDAQAARPHYIEGQVVKTKRTFPREESGEPESRLTVKTLYVRGIEEDFGEKDLREYFGSYGNIVDINIITDEDTGKKKGFAFVEFDDYDPVDKIVLQHHYNKGTKLHVEKFLTRLQKANIKMMKEMGSFGRGRCGGEIYRGGYVGGYESGYGRGYGLGRGGWNYITPSGYSYPSGRGDGFWGGNFGPIYGGGPVQGNTGYAQISQGGGRKGGQRASGRVGRR